MSKLKKLITNHREKIRWAGQVLIVIVLGVSIILNVAYLPSYFREKSFSELPINVHINAYDDTRGKTESIKVISANYPTKVTSLSNLMAQYNDTYELKYGSAGPWLNGVSYYDDIAKKVVNLEGDNSRFWTITSPTNSACKGKTDPYIKYDNVCNMGADYLIMSSDDYFQLYLIKITNTRN